MSNEKAVSVFKRILENIASVQNIVQSGAEYYFTYKGHFFSVTKFRTSEGTNAVTGFVYPRWTGTMDVLVHNMDNGDLDVTPIVSYKADSSDENELFVVLSALHQSLDSKHLNLDSVFDDILDG